MKESAKAALHGFKSHFMSPIRTRGEINRVLLWLFGPFMMGGMFCAVRFPSALHSHPEPSFCWEMSPEKSLPAPKWLQSPGKSSGELEWHPGHSPGALEFGTSGKSCRGDVGKSSAVKFSGF